MPYVPRGRERHNITNSFTVDNRHIFQDWRNQGVGKDEKSQEAIDYLIDYHQSTSELWKERAEWAFYHLQKKKMKEKMKEKKEKRKQRKLRNLRFDNELK